MMIHAKAADLAQGNIVIRASDTDIAVILLRLSVHLMASM